ncbi:MAG: YggS family pyridoxal phosphate-dependent enzyme [Paludibacteraceae bacterium]|nr:YggS family pyridoxal phosphate-dependent enzyme [Paludibacteraceae bacterium]
MTDIKKNYCDVLASVNGKTLVAVSKFHPEEELMEAYDAGCRVFGESHVQGLERKPSQLPSDISWHFIGHLQRNKVAKIVPYVSLIHSVDSLRLLEEINKQAVKIGRKVNVLLQLHVAAEETKFGFTLEEINEMFKETKPETFTGVVFKGIMAMATNTDDESRIVSDFEAALNAFNTLKKTFFKESEEFSIKSYGMSDDYPIALEHGSNMVRVGTRIFGPRVY